MRRTALYGMVWVMVVCGVWACRGPDPYLKWSVALNKLSARERWSNLARIPGEADEPSLRLLAVAQRGDHISRTQALLLLSEVPWNGRVEPGMRQLVAGVQDEVVRAAAVRALSRHRGFSHDVSALMLQRLRDASWLVRRYALQYLLKEKASAESRAWCQRALQDPHPAVRWDAILCWRRLHVMASSRDVRAVQLLPLLADPNRRVRRLARQTLGWWSPPARVTLQRALAHRKPVVRCGALRAVGSFRTHAATVAGWIKKRLRDPSPRVQRCAMRALRQLSTHSKHARDPLLEALRHPNEMIVLRAIRTIRTLDPPMRRAVPQLLAMAQSPQMSLRKRFRAVTAIRAILTNPKHPKRKIADAVFWSLLPQVRESLFGWTPPANNTVTDVSFGNFWSAGVNSRTIRYQIGKDYLPQLERCDATWKQRKDRTPRRYWVEFFLERHGRVVLPFVFRTDRKTVARDPCLEGNLWAWKFPQLRSQRFAYVQFQIQLAPVKPEPPSPDL